jgi:photosystem II stability/assembly factor-like uncharacterized protein
MNGQYLFRSLDSGTSWDQRPLPASAPAPASTIAFVSATEGWLQVTGPPATQCQAQLVILWHTTDAGTSWQQLSATGIDAAQCKNALSFVDARHGFIAAWDQNHPPVLYRTTDGGLTWAPSAPLPDPPGFSSQPGGVTLHPGKVHAFGTVLLVPVQSAGDAGLSVFKSTDSGVTWTSTARAPQVASSIGLVTATHWLQIITPGQSVETTDAGATWHPSPSDYAQAAPIAPVVIFADDQVGYATVRGGIQRTLDGGEHWSIIRSPGTTGS